MNAVKLRWPKCTAVANAKRLTAEHDDHTAALEYATKPLREKQLAARLAQIREECRREVLHPSAEELLEPGPMDAWSY